MQNVWIAEIKTELFKYSFRKSESVEIIDETKIWENYTQIIETKKIDKMKIKEDLKNWIEIDWVKLLQNKNLQFK
jgi:hypothetical protein